MIVNRVVLRNLDLYETVLDTRHTTLSGSEHPWVYSRRQSRVCLLRDNRAI